MKEIKEGTYEIPENLRAIVTNSGKTLIVQKRKARSPYLPEGEYRCKDCVHFILGRWSANPKYTYKTRVCEMKPKKNEGCYHSCPDYGKPCEHFVLKSK